MNGAPGLLRWLIGECEECGAFAELARGLLLPSRLSNRVGLQSNEGVILLPRLSIDHTAICVCWLFVLAGA
jgi:hypothetical protein